MEVNKEVKNVRKHRQKKDPKNFNTNFFTDEEYIYYRTYLKRAMGAVIKRIDEDIISETMLRGMEFSHQFNPDKASKKTWLFTIMRNIIYTEYRLDKRYVKGELNDDHTRLLEYKQDIDNHPEYNYLDEIIEELKESKIMWALREYTLNNKSYQEISDEHGYALGTIKTMIHRDRKLINEKWQRYKEK